MKQLKRGSAAGDEKEFSVDAVRQLKTAAAHIQYLVNEGYAIKNASVFVGNHFLLSERQRLALVRSIHQINSFGCAGKRNAGQMSCRAERCILTDLTRLLRWKLRCAGLCCYIVWTEQFGIWRDYGEPIG